MSDDDTLRRAREAREILEHPLVVETLAKMRAHCVEMWERSPITKRDEREMLYLYRTALTDFEAHFTGLIEDGQFLEKRDAQREREKKAARGESY
jgi:hypothetical protein